MSLFKAREWWSTIVGNKEEFDQGCLCVANIDNSSSAQDKIIVGSYMGFLRIYHPHPIKPGHVMQAEDMLLEVQLCEPILQVEVGKFVSGTELLHLAVLHCKKLCVYAVSGSLGNTEYGNQYQLKCMYEHSLYRTAYNMTYGPFGGIKDDILIFTETLEEHIKLVCQVLKKLLVVKLYIKLCNWLHQGEQEIGAFKQDNLGVVTKFYQHILALVFAIDEINYNPKILPNATLGFHVFDSYSDSKMTYRTVLDLLFTSQVFVPNYKCGSQKNAIGIIGGFGSDTTSRMADILHLYKIPQLHSFLQRISFNNSAGDEITFNDHGELAGGFDITNLATFSNNSYIKVQVGRLDPHKGFTIDEDKIEWERDFTQVGK
ncbi:PREDICTED: uncharacterized protein LOC106543667 [Thamnophis sirtalis]|uniref:Uncharacterized protein LOC106543667 n=1 Tax=Thamnophis sirtalis TaxID=35019 RepID=A0A6I9XMQ6_9SAUR|nr:PREDICTED: uncharacterized protein LOC106543667 [Thamnophis sirtalis]